MICIYPEVEIKITCLVCKHEFQPNSFHLTGVHVLGSGICPYCKSDELFKELPTSAGLLYPTIIRKSDGKRVDDIPFTNWFIDGLSVAYKNKTNESVGIEKVVNQTKQKKKLLILNTIDHTYGHCVLNIFNLSYYKSKTDYHLLLLVQRDLLWLVPDGIDEIWIVDIPFSKGGQWFEFLATTVNDDIRKYEQAFLCRTFPQAPEGEFNIAEYSRVKPFPLNEWDERLKTPTVTFIWRTDRFWKRVLPRWVDNRITRGLFPDLITKIKNRIRFNWILKFARELRKKAPGVDFAIAGMDSRDMKLPDWIKDYRHSSHSDELAKELCRRYAESHLVIGCNGSSLVLPGCHAGAVMNIVPQDGWSVSTGSFFFRFTSIADTFYRYALIHSETSIERMVTIAVQILRDRSMVQLISGTPWNDHESNKRHEDWAAFRRQIFRNTHLFTEKEGLMSKEFKNK